MSAVVLVVEDDMGSRDLVEYLLRSAGYDVIGAMNAREGLEWCERITADLVLCDLQMPGLDGFGFLAEARKKPGYEKIPIVAVTAFTMLGDRDRALAAGFNGYISKPIEPERFVAAIERCLQRPSR